jgi:DNA-binding transcriptional regulator GbsR (MarR family)
MKLTEAKQQFIQSWGALGSQWGINKTMAQIHALLLVSERPLSADEMMETLQISRGNVNTNTRALIDWGIVEKSFVLGERKEFFVGEKDIWKVATKIASERRKRELAPVIKVLEQIQQVEDPKADPAELKEFKKVVKDLEGFSNKVDGMFDKLTKADQHWFTGTLMKLIK